MVASQLGIRLLLLVGPTLPLPAPYSLMSALSKVEVTNDAASGDGFQLTFTLAKTPGLDYSLLTSGQLNPFNRVIIGVILGVIPQVLIDGVITHHQLTPSPQPGASTLTVTGKDISLMLDLKEKDAGYDNQPDFAIVTRLIAQYAQYGLIPAVTPTTNVPIMIQNIPHQHETDLKFIQRLAQRNGFVFYVEPVTVGVNKAYFGVENRLSLPQPALSMNMGTHSNVNSLSFTQDALAPTGTQGSFVEPTMRITIPIPALPSLKIPPLSVMPVAAQRTTIQRETASQNAGLAATTAVAAVTNAPDAVTGTGEVDAALYGNVLRARQLVGVRGVGFSYNGNYYVRRVTHHIEPGKYTQSFTLSREGTGALLPVVRP
jgi:hypothetical protein